MKQMDSLFVCYKQGFKRVSLNDVVILMAARSYCDITTNCCGTLTVSAPLCDVFSKITHSDFVRIHRSYVINVQHIDSLMGNMVYMSTGDKLTIGREYRRDFFDSLIFVGAKGK